MFNRRVFLQTGMAGISASILRASERPPSTVASPETSRGRMIAAIERSLKIDRNIPFVKRPQRTLYLDVYREPRPRHESLPAILYFGLSAWRSDTKKFWAYILGLDRLGNSPTVYLYPPLLVPRGYVVVSAECRVAHEAKFPAQIHDGKCAIKWVRAHAKEFNIDPKRIGVMGGSASGYLAAMLAVTRPEDGFDDKEYDPSFSSDLQAAYCQSGMYDFVYYHQHPGDKSLERDGSIRDFLGGSYSQIPETWRKASPFDYVRSGDPPFLLMHGIQDRRVPYSQMSHFASSLKNAGVPVQAVSINHFVHGAIPGVMPQPPVSALDRTIFQFFDRTLSPR